jgi:DNA polymerase III subunit epsilon
MLAKALNLTRAIIVLDLETTSANPESAKIVSYAHRVHQPDGKIGVYQTLIDPDCPIPPESTAVHGITNEMVKLGCAVCRKPSSEHYPDLSHAIFKPVPQFRHIADNLFRGFKDKDFCGYNVKSFDLKVLDREFIDCGYSFDISSAAVLDPYKIWLAKRPRSLSDAYQEFCGKNLEGAHDAAIDVQAAEDVLLGMIDRFELPRDPREIHDLTFPKDPNWVDSEGKFVFINGVPCFNFGTNKGTPMRLKKGYMEWMIDPKRNFSTEVKNILSEALQGRYPEQK